jgi:hypothetical protein
MIVYDFDALLIDLCKGLILTVINDYLKAHCVDMLINSRIRTTYIKIAYFSKHRYTH